MKKVLSLVLVIAMVLSSMSFAFASTFEDVADSDYAVAIETMKALGVIDGFPDGSFRPEEGLTRAQLAKLLVEALGFGGLAGGASNFSDTNGHWADGYIAIAAGMGLVNGYPDGTFKPEGDVSYEEAYAMVIRALGYTDASLRGVWPTNYMVKALDLGLTKNLALTTGPADRGGVAQVLYNALEAKFVIVDADNNITPVKEGAETLIDRLGEITTLEVSLDNLDPEDKAYKGNVVDLAPYMYQKLTVYENKDGDVVYVKSVDSLVVEAEVVKFDGTELEVEYKDKKYAGLTTTGAAFFINGEEADKLELDKEDVVTLVLDEDSDEKFVAGMDVLGVVARKATGTVQAMEDYVDGELEIEADPNVILPVDDDEVDFERLLVTGEVDALEDIEEDDVLALYYGKGVADEDNKLEIHVTRKVVEGKVTRKNSSDHVTIGGTVYKPVGDSTEDISVGDEVVLYLDQDGKVFSYSDIDSNVDEDYAVVLDVYNGYETSGGTRLADPKVKLLTASGEKITYVIDEALDVVTGTVDLIVDEDLIGALVEYSLDDDEIDAIKVVGEEKEGLKTSGNSFNVASGAPIFNLPKADIDAAEVNVDSAKVVDVEDLTDSVDAFVVYDGAKIVALVIYGSVTEADEVYALIVSSNALTLDEDDKTVVEYTAYVEGEKVTYLGTSKTVVDSATPSGILVELTIEDGKLIGADNVDEITADVTFTGKLKAADKRVSTYIEATGGPFYLADDVIVYVVEDDGDVVLGSKSDIKDKYFVAYNLNLKDTDDYGIVVVFEQE